MNWKKVINRIKRYGGLTDAEIAKEVDTTQQNISRIKLGTNLLRSWELGDKLLELESRTRKPK